MPERIRPDQAPVRLGEDVLYYVRTYETASTCQKNPHRRNIPSYASAHIFQPFSMVYSRERSRAAAPIFSRSASSPASSDMYLSHSWSCLTRKPVSPCTTKSRYG